MLLLLAGTWGVLLMKVPKSYLSMVHTNEMLGEIVGQVLLSWVPLHIEISHLDLICHPKESSVGPDNARHTSRYELRSWRAKRLGLRCWAEGPRTSSSVAFSLRDTLIIVSVPQFLPESLL